jgi:hypothetical protein
MQISVASQRFALKIAPTIVRDFGCDVLFTDNRTQISTKRFVYETDINTLKIKY